MNEQTRGLLFTLIACAVTGYATMNYRDGQAGKLPAIPDFRPVSPAAPVQTLQATKIGPANVFFGPFGKSTHVWVVAPATGKTLEFDVTDSDITIPQRRTVGDAGSQP